MDRVCLEGFWNRAQIHAVSYALSNTENFGLFLPDFYSALVFHFLRSLTQLLIALLYGLLQMQIRLLCFGVSRLWSKAGWAVGQVLMLFAHGASDASRRRR